MDFYSAFTSESSSETLTAPSQSAILAPTPSGFVCVIDHLSLSGPAFRDATGN